MWTDDLTLMIRALINDMGTILTYTDERIQQTIVTAGLIVSQEFPYLNNDYTFDLSTPNLVPDPTIAPYVENQAIALFTLKAACILNMNSFMKATGGGIKVKSGDDAVDTSVGFKGYEGIIKDGPCKSYQDLLKILSFKAGSNLGRAVMSPFSDFSSEFSHGRGGLWSIQNFYNSFMY